MRNVAAGRAAAGAAAGRSPAPCANRFAAFVAVFALVAFLVGRWRGPKAFTLHCGRCGTAFCRYCHLGQVSGGLCSQCYHLFVVRDGVSGPARNRKMAEVQRAEGRRERVFRVLSRPLPRRGAGLRRLDAPRRGAARRLVRGRWRCSWPVGWCPSRRCRGACRRRGWRWRPGSCSSRCGWPRTGSAPSFDVELPARPAGPRRARAAQAAG